ncbi:MAG: peroxiredoxin [Asgard group archaeon]|nr:peroxiredoxin [Asgard group archaeon]
MSEEKQGFPLIGDKAPSFTATTTHGKINFPDDYKGKWVVFFSHPADFTPVCTTEFIGFQKRKKDFDRLGASLIGLSVDQVYSHIKWVEWIKEKMDVDIEFPIIADHGQIGKLYGMIHPNKSSSTVRAVFIIDPEGIIRAMVYYPPEMGRNMDEFVRIVEAFQVADKNKVAMPANWPNNEILKDRVIIPPPQDVETAKKRPKEYECYDWWLCHKERPK